MTEDRIRLMVSAWIHNDGQDDDHFSTCLGEYPNTDEGKAEARELVVELLKLQGSKDLTDFEMISVARDPSQCIGCQVSDICDKEESS